MVHPSTDNFWRLGLGCPGHSSDLGVYRTMRTFKIVAAAMLFAAVAAVASPAVGQAREHILGADGVDREHILSGDAGTLREHIL